MKKIYKPYCGFYLSIAPEKKEFVKKKLKGFTVICKDKPLKQNNIDAKTEVLGIFVDSKIDKKVFDKLPHLKLIMLLSTGYDNVDLDTAKQRNVSVCNVPSYGEITVAEHALALLLSLLKNIPQSMSEVRNGHFNCLDLRGFDLQGKTVGVVGTGKIGVNFIRLVSAFGVKVVAYDAFPNPQKAEQLGFTYVSFKQLLKQSDIISLHVPLLKETHHLINRESLAQMKKGVYVINTSRGAIVDSIALVKAVKTGQVKGAGLDVLEGEEYLKSTDNILPGCEREAKNLCKANKILIDHKNVIVTPHNAFNTEEAIQRIFYTAIEIIEDFSKRKELKNRIV